MDDSQIERRMQELRETAKQFAKAYALTEYLSEYKKSKLAILSKKYEREGHKTSAAQERESRADPEYRELLVALQSAIEESERLRWELKVAEIGAEVWRTQAANRRAERKGYGA